MEENKDWYKNVCLKSGKEMEIDWWSPEPNEYKVTFLSEAGDKYKVTFDGKTREKVPIEIEVGGKQYIMGVTIAISETSLFGQLVKLALKHDGIKGVTTTILVQGTGKNRKYTIPETINFDINEFKAAK